MLRRTFHTKCNSFNGAYTAYAYAWTGDIKTLPQAKLTCLFDTGSDIGMIDIKTAQKLHIKKTDKLTLSDTAGGQTFSDIYIANICFPNGMAFKNRPLKGIDLPVGLIIGMDIISTGKFSMAKNNGNMRLSFSTNQYDFYIPHWKLPTEQFRESE